MYAKQRTDALADWNANNQYNSPQEQMRRFKQAGLNPNLIYGQQNTAQPVRSSSVQDYKPQPMQVDPNTIGDAVNTYFNVQKQKAEISNLESQNRQIEANTNYLNLKAITEANMPENVKSKTELNYETGKNTNARTHLTQLQDSQLADLYPIVKRIKTNTALNLLASTDNYRANIRNTNARTKTEDALRDPRVQKTNAEIYNVKMNSLLKEYQQATESQKREKIAQEIINLRSKGNILEKDDQYYEIGGSANFLKSLLKK
ncbi:MAG: DNA pilot protein [Microvirus sp.]|nr:MAG: DNA pilot protein [Microvirus sp.]